MHDAQTDERSAFAKPWFVMSAVFLGLLLLAAAFTLISADTGDHSQASSGPSATTTAVSAARVRASGSAAGCSLPAGSQTVPTSAPVMDWVTVGEMAVPQAPRSYGPERTENGIGVCFAHDPTGALLAAVNFFAQATSVHPATLLRTLAANTPGRQVALLQAQAGGAGQLLQDSDGDPGSVQVSGFQVIDYTPAEANLDVVLQGPEGELGNVECQLLWEHADWKMVIPSGGEMNTSLLSSLDGFVAWSEIPAGTLGGQS